MLTLLNFYLRAEENESGWPQVSIYLDDQMVADCACNNELVVTVDLTDQQDYRQLLIRRSGPGAVLEITKITLNGIIIPDYVITKNSSFNFNDQSHPGSLYFVPTGTWIWDIGCPMVTWILDEKIKHESLYSQDYQYPWSYSFGPDSVEQLNRQLLLVKHKVNDIL